MLRRLAEGLTHKEIAMAEGLSLRTVARMAVKLDAPAPFVLGMQAARRGIARSLMPADGARLAETRHEGGGNPPLT